MKQKLPTNKSANDYRRELRETNLKLTSTEAHIKVRLLEMIKTHPDAIVTQMGGTDIKASGVTEDWIDRQNIETQLEYLSSIEDYSEKKFGVHQIKFDG